MKLTNIKPNPNNPRLIKDDKFNKLVQSIKDFPEMMEKRPIVCVTDVDGKIYPLGGNMRYKALKEIGYKDVPDNWIVMADDWTEDKRREFVIKDNVGFGEWHWEQLANDWDNEELEAWGLDVPSFETEEVLEAVEDDFDSEPPTEPITVLGDLYEIGEHRLLCGDSTDSDQVAKLMKGEKADIMVSDPPYGIDLDTDYSKMGSTTTKYEKIKGDDKEFDLTDVISISGTKEQYIWGGDYFVNSLDWMSGTQIIWAKRHSEEENKVFGSAFESLWVSYKCKKVIWFIRPINQSSERLGQHPTQKPIECMSRCIEMSKLQGGIYDAFLGSGSTMVASHQLKRKCYGMELDPKYCDVIVKRMLKLDPTLVIKRNGVVTKDFE
jgi:site-specific DNA-methyltransferase (adenine-specific)